MGDVVKSKEELARRLGIVYNTLWRIENRNPLNPPPEMNADGGFDVDEWRAWLDGIEADAESGGEKELLQVRIATEKERFRGLQFKNDLAAGKYIKKDRFVEFGKRMITRFRNYIDDLDEKAAILFAGDARLEQLRAIAADAEAQMAEDFAKDAERNDSEDL